MKATLSQGDVTLNIELSVIQEKLSDCKYYGRLDISSEIKEPGKYKLEVEYIPFKVKKTLEFTVDQSGIDYSKTQVLWLSSV